MMPPPPPEQMTNRFTWEGKVADHAVISRESFSRFRVKTAERSRLREPRGSKEHDGVVDSLLAQAPQRF